MVYRKLIEVMKDDLCSQAGYISTKLIKLENDESEDKQSARDVVVEHLRNYYNRVQPLLDFVLSLDESDVVKVDCKCDCKCG